MPTTETHLLALDGITVTFGGLTALDQVDLAVDPGEIVGVIGPNGAGKTTLFNVACGFTAPTVGSVSWQGDDVTRLGPHRRARLGMSRTLQGLGLFDGLSVLENVTVGLDRQARAGFGSSLLALPSAARDERRLRDRAREVLVELDIADHADRLPGSLPYALRKRVALARAVAADSKLIMLDEPASGLSEDEMSELADVIRSLTDRMAVVLVEHHMELVMSVCERLVVLDFGKVIARGLPDEIRDDPAVLAAYLGDEVPPEASTEEVR